MRPRDEITTPESSGEVGQAATDKTFERRMNIENLKLFWSQSNSHESDQNSKLMESSVGKVPTQKGQRILLYRKKSIISQITFRIN